MNQKNNFSRPECLPCVAGTEPRSKPIAVMPVRALVLLMLSLMFASALAPDSAVAQSDFVPPTRHSLAPITPALPPARVASREMPLPLPPISFPDTAIPFDANVIPADLNVPIGEGDSTSNDDSLDSAIESASAMFTNMKDGFSEKTSGWLTALKQEGSWSEKFRSIFGSSDISRMLGSLALVLGGYFSFVWLMKKINPSGNAGLPPEVIEVLGSVPFGPRRSLQLVRLGSKLLLLMNDAEGTRPIGEITDPAEAEYLSSLCLGKRKSSFHNVQALQNAALQNAAQRIQESQPAPASPTRAPVPAPETMATLNTNLANVLRSLENATRKPGTSYEA